MSVAAGNNAAADPVSDFYQGKSVTVVVASGAGGTHSACSLLFSPRLQANMPGADGTKGANYLYNSAPGDGSSIGIPLADTPLTARRRTTGAK